MFSKILFPVDMHDCRIESLQRACEIAQSFSAKLLFLHVQPIPPIPMQDDGAVMNSLIITEELLAEMGNGDPDPKELENALERIYPELKMCGCQYSMVRGDLADSVASFVKGHQIDLVITEHRHVHGTFHWLFRSGDEVILGKVDVPVLVLPR